MGLADLQKAPREVVYGVRSDGFRLGLQTVYAPWLTDIFREHGGAWHAQGRMWVFPRSAVNGAFAQRLAKEAPSGVVFTVQATVDLITHALASPEADLFADGIDIQIFPVAGGGSVLQFKRDLLLEQTLRAMAGKLLQGRTGWFVDLDVHSLLDALALQAGIDRAFAYVHDSEIILTDTVGNGADDRPSLGVGGAEMESGNTIEIDQMGSVLSVVTSPMERFDVSETLLDFAVTEFSLFDYQRAGVAHFLRYSSAANCDDMGLGKSRQAAVAAHLITGDGAVLVVCPSSLKINWEREIHLIAPDADVAIVGERKDWEKASWIVVNYERLGTIVQSMNEKRVKVKVMVCDEAHYLKEPTSGRTRNAFLIAKHVNRRFLLTATPILNREAEIHTLLRLSGHPIGELPAAEFTKQFAGSPAVRIALKERITEWMIRRPKSVVKGLKGKSHQLQYVELAGEDIKQYRQVSGDPDIAALVKIGQLRQLLERFKRTWLIETIGAMAPEDKVLVFTEHLEIVAILHDELAAAGIRSVTYTGAMSLVKKQQSVDTFQQDPDTRVFIGLRKAAGVGLTLTAANYVIPVSLPWNGALRRQAEDRAYRHGQTRHVTVLIPIVPRTIDEKVLALNRYKEAIESELLEDAEDRPPNPLDVLDAVA